MAIFFCCCVSSQIPMNFNAIGGGGGAGGGPLGAGAGAGFTVGPDADGGGAALGLNRNRSRRTSSGLVRGAFKDSRCTSGAETWPGVLPPRGLAAPLTLDAAGVPPAVGCGQNW